MFAASLPSSSSRSADPYGSRASALLLWRFSRTGSWSACDESVSGDEVAAFEIVPGRLGGLEECVDDEVSSCMPLCTLGCGRVWGE